MNITFITYNRPDTAEAVLNTIHRARPERLFVIADSPAPGDEKNIARCELVRSLVDAVDWDCEVHRNYAEEHMGLQKRIPSGLSWVFDQVSDSIILEDDCLPHPSFFSYCSALLDRYRDDERIMAISGENFAAAQGFRRGEYSYYFSKYFHCWGWASWARAWKKRDCSLSNWPDFRDGGGLDALCRDSAERSYWIERMDKEAASPVKSWDYTYMYSCWVQSGLSILPNVNLVSNIGFGRGGTYATDAYSWQANLPTEDIGELKHPPFVFRNEQADRYEFEFSRQKPGGAKKIMNTVARMFGHKSS